LERVAGRYVPGGAVLGGEREPTLARRCRGAGMVRIFSRSQRPLGARAPGARFGLDARADTFTDCPLKHTTSLHI
jgi:hypothetical protein